MHAHTKSLDRHRITTTHAHQTLDCLKTKLNRDNRVGVPCDTQKRARTLDPHTMPTRSFLRSKPYQSERNREKMGVEKMVRDATNLIEERSVPRTRRGDATRRGGGVEEGRTTAPWRGWRKRWAYGCGRCSCGRRRRHVASRSTKMRLGFRRRRPPPSPLRGLERDEGNRPCRV